MAEQPRILSQAQAGNLDVAVLEWHWPSVVDYANRTTRLTVEMSLPPYNSSAAACFPEIDPTRFCFMGTIFLRYPGYLVRARGPGGRIRVLQCSFDEETTARLTADLPEPSLETLQNLLNVRSSQVRSILRLIQRELDMETGPSASAIAALGALLEIESGRVLGNARQPVSRKGALADWQFRKIWDQLASCNGRVEVEVLARSCGISTRQLQRQFASLTGNTVSEYMQMFWLERCKAMLVETDLPLRAIAETLNFSHPSTFSRAFRQATGMTASGFRKAFRNAPQPN